MLFKVLINTTWDLGHYWNISKLEKIFFSELSITTIWFCQCTKEGQEGCMWRVKVCVREGRESRLFLLRFPRLLRTSNPSCVNINIPPSLHPPRLSSLISYPPAPAHLPPPNNTKLGFIMLLGRETQAWPAPFLPGVCCSTISVIYLYRSVLAVTASSVFI